MLYYLLLTECACGAGGGTLGSKDKGTIVDSKARHELR